jgi:hypothetical protein
MCCRFISLRQSSRVVGLGWMVVVLGLSLWVGHSNSQDKYVRTPCLFVKNKIKIKRGYDNSNDARVETRVHNSNSRKNVLKRWIHSLRV